MSEEVEIISPVLEEHPSEVVEAIEAEELAADLRTDDEVNAAILRASKEENKPDISRLLPVFNKDGKFTPVIGDKIVMEVNSAGKWLHTRQYVIQTIDHESGNMWLMNDELGQHAGANYKTLSKYGFEMRMAPGRGRVVGAKRRGRPPADSNIVQEQPKVAYNADGSKLKKKRGRPKKDATE